MTTVKTRIKNALDLMYVQPTELILTPKFILNIVFDSPFP